MAGTWWIKTGLPAFLALALICGGVWALAPMTVAGAGEQEDRQLSQVDRASIEADNRTEPATDEEISKAVEVLRDDKLASELLAGLDYSITGAAPAFNQGERFGVTVTLTLAEPHNFEKAPFLAIDTAAQILRANPTADLSSLVDHSDVDSVADLSALAPKDFIVVQREYSAPGVTQLQGDIDLINGRVFGLSPYDTPPVELPDDWKPDPLGERRAPIVVEEG